MIARVFGCAFMLLAPGGRTPVVVRPDTTPVRGVVLLIPGGSTLLKLDPNGETKSTNFVIRTRQMLIDAGYAIAYMDNPADLREPIQRLRTNGPDLVILTSPVTIGPGTLGTFDARSLRIPTLVTTNENDTCRASPPGEAAALALRLGTNGSYTSFSSSQVSGDVCEPFSPHGYLGIESDVIGKIIAWISAHTS